MRVQVKQKKDGSSKLAHDAQLVRVRSEYTLDVEAPDSLGESTSDDGHCA